MNKTILKSKSIKSEAFREYSRLQGYVTSSIALIQKALYYEVTPTFAKVKGQFIDLKISALLKRSYYFLISKITVFV